MQTEDTHDNTASQLAELKALLLNHPEDFRNRDLLMLLPERLAILRTEGLALFDKIDKAGSEWKESDDDGKDDEYVCGPSFARSCAGSRGLSEILKKQGYGYKAEYTIEHIREVVDALCGFEDPLDDIPGDDWFIETGVALLAGFRHTGDAEPARTFIRAYIKDKETAELAMGAIEHIWAVTLEMCKFQTNKLIPSATPPADRAWALDKVIAGVLLAIVVDNYTDGEPEDGWWAEMRQLNSEADQQDE